MFAAEAPINRARHALARKYHPVMHQARRRKFIDIRWGGKEQMAAERSPEGRAGTVKYARDVQLGSESGARSSRRLSILANLILK